MEIEIKNNLKITDCPFEPELKTRLTMANPKFQDAGRMGRYTGNIPRTLKFYEETDTGLEAPRGYLDQLMTLCRTHGVEPGISDNRRELSPVSFEFQGELWPLQEPACC